MAPQAISLFAGIGGFDLAFERAGFQIAAQVELDAGCRQLLSKRWPSITTIPNVKDAGKNTLPACDIVMGGSPCQGFSINGTRKGRADERSQLSWEYIRVCQELRPRALVWENVPGILAMPDNAFGHFLAAVAGADEAFPCPNGGRWTGAGVAIGPARICGWRILDAQYFGVAQRRRRLFVVGVAREAENRDPGGHTGAERLQQILFIQKSLRRNDAEGVARPSAAFTGCDEAPSGYACTVHGCDWDLCGCYPDDDFHCPFCDEWTSGLYYSRDEGCQWCGAWVARTCGTLTDGAKNGGGLNGQDAKRGRVLVDDRGRVRRLTPTECERLQGFPDGWTAGHSDARRFRMLANAVCVNVAQWLEKRIAKLF